MQPLDNQQKIEILTHCDNQIKNNLKIIQHNELHYRSFINKLHTNVKIKNNKCGKVDIQKVWSNLLFLTEK